MFFNSLNHFINVIHPPSYVDNVHNHATKSLVLYYVCDAICCMQFRNNIFFEYEATVPIFIIIIWLKSDVLFPMAKLCMESGLDNATYSNPAVVLVCSVVRLTINFTNGYLFSQEFIDFCEQRAPHKIEVVVHEWKSIFLTSLCHNRYWYTSWWHSWNRRVDTLNFGGRGLPANAQ